MFFFLLIIDVIWIFDCVLLFYMATIQLNRIDKID